MDNLLNITNNQIGSTEGVTRIGSVKNNKAIARFEV
jgi:hypothetical protein